MSREAPAAARLAGFAVALTVAFGAAYAAGTLLADGDAVGEDLAGPGRPPVSDAAPEPRHDAAVAAAAPLPGLSTTQDGFALRPVTTVVEPGTAVPYAFTVTRDGVPLTDYRPTHERDLHLVVIRRDLTGFQHVHPTRAADGTWTAALDLTDAGSHRVFADFAPADGEPLTLGTDVHVAGPFTPVPVPPPAPTSSVGGYDVSLSATPVAGAESDLTFTVTRAGRPVTDVQPYLGAFGHLVALRAGDLAYLHTHALDSAAGGEVGGPDLRFAAQFPTAGTYRLHLDFQVGGQVRTAAFTVEVPQRTAAAATEGTSADAPTAEHPTTGHGH